VDKKIIDKFFTNQATPEEKQRALDWFDAPEGKKYLRERFELDKNKMDIDSEEIRAMVPELDSERLYQEIRKKLESKSQKGHRLNRKKWVGFAVKIAALILVILTASLFTITHDRCAVEEVVERMPVIFQTDEEQHRKITLGDGTEIRLNSNSEMVVSKDFMNGNREITLTGEAYFDVEHNPEQPFIIHANQATVEVLGTAFNVRSRSGQNNVQVAVVEGKVSFKNTSQEMTEKRQLSVTLSKGQYGYMDVSDRSITVDDVAIENYLAWKNGRLIFEDLKLHQACKQLNRLYKVECSFADDEFGNLQLTSNFSDNSLEKALSVIALSLEIDFKKDGNHVHWTRDN